MHLRRVGAALLEKEWRELMASRAYWLLLAIIGPLAGHAFITAVQLYAEASGSGGGQAALPQGLTPLDGILVPTFGAYDLAVTLLFPFVAILLVSQEKESGARKLMLQSPASPALAVAVKGLVLLAAWLVAWIPAFVAVGFWAAYGGTVYPPELSNLLLGHALRVMLSAGVAIAAASLASSASTAAIITLAFTVGTWALDFIAAGRGGYLQQIASFTPNATLRVFEQGELRLSIVLVSLIMTTAGFAVATVPLRRLYLVAAVAVPLAALAAIPRASWDFSENRRNSFAPNAEAALRTIRSPLRITINLAAEDPRLADYERGILNKLRRILPQLSVDYATRGRTGLFAGANYGEIWYELDGRKVMSRSTTEPIVLDNLFQLAGIAPKAVAEEAGFSGHPLVAEPGAAPWIFYLLWPLCVGLAWWYLQLRRTS